MRESLVGRWLGIAAAVSLSLAVSTGAFAAAVTPTYPTLAKAQKKATFRIQAPGWVPAHYVLSDVGLLLRHQKWAMLSYGRHRAATTTFILNEAYGKPTLAVGAPRTAVTFKGVKGYVQRGKNGAIRWVSLAWGHGSYTFILTAYGTALKVSALEKIAESVHS